MSVLLNLRQERSDEDDIGEKNDEIDRVEIMDCTLLIEEEQEDR